VVGLRSRRVKARKNRQKQFLPVYHRQRFLIIIIFIIITLFSSFFFFFVTLYCVYKSINITGLLPADTSNCISFFFPVHRRAHITTHPSDDESLTNDLRTITSCRSKTHPPAPPSRHLDTTGLSSIW
jgi:hypothetical protein